MGLVITPLDTPKRFNPLTQPLGAPQKLGGRELVWRFDGGDITSDGGALLLKKLEERTGIVRRFAACFTDYRSAKQIEHPLLDLILQRVFGLALGYEDLGEAGVPGRIYFRRRAETAFNIALVAHGGSIWIANLALRDFLRANPDAAREYEMPLGFGLLTCDTDEQAEARAGGAHGNKGADAALAALEMADLLDRLDTTDAG